MDLILWRHAEAVDVDESGNDLNRSLTSRGEKDAARIAAWLDRQLPEGMRILCSTQLRRRKGAVWWLRTREREGHPQTVLAAVQSPDML